MANKDKKGKKIKKNLTLLQKKFCYEYCKCGEIYQACINAGYKESFAKAKGYRLLDNELVQKEIARINEAKDRTEILEVEECQKLLSKSVKGEIELTSGQLKSMEMLMRSQGGFVDKKEVNAEVIGNVMFCGEEDIQE